MSKRKTGKSDISEPSQKARSRAPDYPRHNVEAALRIPESILNNNAGNDWSDDKVAKSLGLSGPKGRFSVEIGSGIKYGFLVRPSSGVLGITELARKALKPQREDDRIHALQEAIQNAPILGDVYKYYRGNNLPQKEFFYNTLTDSFKIPQDRLEEFTQVFRESLKAAALLEESGDLTIVVNISTREGVDSPNTVASKKRANKNIKDGDSCFVIMPFAEPLGKLYTEIYEPAIKDSGLVAIRGDDDIFVTGGSIINQIWRGISQAKLLIAELTDRNLNVFYELGLAHALKKPVILVSRNKEDVPFDVQHIRVIFYDINDPFWGDKLKLKIKDMIITTLENPSDGMLFKDE